METGNISQEKPVFWMKPKKAAKAFWMPPPAKYAAAPGEPVKAPALPAPKAPSVPAPPKLPVPAPKAPAAPAKPYEVSYGDLLPEPFKLKDYSGDSISDHFDHNEPPKSLKSVGINVKPLTWSRPDFLDSPHPEGKGRYVDLASDPISSVNSAIAWAERTNPSRGNRHYIDELKDIKDRLLKKQNGANISELINTIEDMDLDGESGLLKNTDSNKPEHHYRDSSGEFEILPWYAVQDYPFKNHDSFKQAVKNENPGKNTLALVRKFRDSAGASRGKVFHAASTDPEELKRHAESIIDGYARPPRFDHTYDYSKPFWMKGGPAKYERQMREALRYAVANPAPPPKAPTTPTAAPPAPKYKLNPAHAPYNQVIHSKIPVGSAPANHNFIHPMIAAAKQKNVPVDDFIHDAVTGILFDPEHKNHISGFEPDHPGGFTSWWEQAVRQIANRAARIGKGGKTKERAYMVTDSEGNASNRVDLAADDEDRRMGLKPKLDSAGRVARKDKSIVDRIRWIMKRRPTATFREFVHELGGREPVEMAVKFLQEKGELPRDFIDVKQRKLPMLDRVQRWIDEHPEGVGTPKKEGGGRLPIDRSFPNVPIENVHASVAALLDKGVKVPGYESLPRLKAGVRTVNRVRERLAIQPDLDFTKLMRVMSHKGDIPADKLAKIVRGLHAIGEAKNIKVPGKYLGPVDRVKDYLSFNQDADYRKASTNFRKLGIPPAQFRDILGQLNREGFEHKLTKFSRDGDPLRYAETDPHATTPHPAPKAATPPTIKAPPPVPKAPPTPPDLTKTKRDLLVDSPNHTADVTPVKFPGRRSVLPQKPLEREDPWWHQEHDVHAMHAGQEIGREKLSEDSGINGAWKVTLAGDHPSGDHHGIWKEADDDQTYLARRNIPDQNPHGHEASAWELSKIFGMNHVPPTIARELHGKVGSMQRFRPGLKHGFESFNAMDSPDVPILSAFDFAIGNSDRHMKNFLVDNNNRITAIDHDMSFPAWSTPTSQPGTSFTSEFLRDSIAKNRPVPKEAIQWRDALPAVERALKRNNLTDAQIRLTRKRIRDLAEVAAKGGTFKDLWAKWGRRMNLWGHK